MFLFVLTPCPVSGDHYKELLAHSESEIVAIGGRPEDKAHPLPVSPRIRYYTLDKLFTEDFSSIDTVINCAFARSNDSSLLAQAFDFTEKLIKRLETLKVKSVINLSSQGVYKRLSQGQLSTEDSPIEPIDLYSMAKYATEKLFSVSNIPYTTSVRLASLMMPQRFLFFFVQKVMSNEPFTVTAPNQYAALLDVKDAASGLVALVSLPPEKRSSIYNLGIGTQYSLLEYAESVQRIGKVYGYEANFSVADNETTVCAGMDCSRLTNDTGWKPTILKEEMIEKIYKNK